MNKEFLLECLNKGMSTRDIEKICDKKRSTISYWIKKYGLTDSFKYKKNEKFEFKKIDTMNKAYVLGFMLADSAINKDNDVEISVALSDKEVVEYISNVINANVMYDHSLNKKSRRFPRARCAKRIPDILKFFGSRLKEYRHYPRIREDLEKYMLLGLFDADGCLTYGRRKDKDRMWQKISFTSQLKILEGVQKYLSKTLDISTVIRPKSNEKCYVLEMSNLKDVIAFCEHIYSDENFIILNRKYLKYKALRLELEENGEGKQSA